MKHKVAEFQRHPLEKNYPFSTELDSFKLHSTHLASWRIVRSPSNWKTLSKV